MIMIIIKACRECRYK